MTTILGYNGEITDYVVSQWMKTFTPAWFSLHFSDPIRGGGIQSEVQGGSYGRKSGVWSNYDTRTIWLETKLTWAGLPEIILTHVGIWDHQYNGTLLSCSQLPVPYPHVVQGGGFELATHTYAISIGLPI